MYSILAIIGSLLIIPLKAQNFDFYPSQSDKAPDQISPLIINDGTEIITAITKNNKYTLIPVTVENGKPLLYSRRIESQYGKDKQLLVNAGDFPALAKSGLHSEAELDGKERISDIPILAINCTARPNGYSYAGFIADDEDIISVLKGDNRIVQKLGLTHPQLAKPLFHVWNIILHEFEVGKFGRFSNIQSFLYNGNSISFKAEGTKGWQVSIFQDEIQGRFDIEINRELTQNENTYLSERYSNLTEIQFSKLVKTLTTINFSEMLPYYIMRYGFYEGHTDYRADPIAIAWIFNLKSIEDIEDALPHKLYDTFNTHLIEEYINAKN